ncbi:MAG: hypothetical protein ACREU2_13525 [Steroidobacteraceae bacterium]
MRVHELPLRAGIGALLTCLSAAVLLSGCSIFHRHRNGSGCHEQQVITDARSRPPLKVPPGLSAPDRTAQIAIPTLAAPEQPRPKDAPCLDQPPKYVSEPLLPPVRQPATPAAPAPQPPPAPPAQ